MLIDIGTFISAVSALVTSLSVLVTVQHFKKQAQLTFFAEYTQRNQDIILKLPEAISAANFDIRGLPTESRDSILRQMRAYFDLCSEEYYLWKNGHIGSDTWKEWEDGIKFALSKRAFGDAWDILAKDTIYNGNFYGFVTETLRQRAI